MRWNNFYTILILNIIFSNIFVSQIVAAPCCPSTRAGKPVSYDSATGMCKIEGGAGPGQVPFAPTQCSADQTCQTDGTCRTILPGLTCPSSVMDCNRLDSIYGGCADGCIRKVINSGSGGGRSGSINGKCQCVTQDSIAPPASLTCGQECTLSSECPSACSVCTPIAQNGRPVCAQKAWQPGDEPLDPLKLEPTTCLGGKGLETALGCIPFEPVSLIGWVLRWAIGVGGGIAFLLMAFASYQLMTSAGNPERLKAGQEMFVSAGAGLLFIIFSVFLLQLIGADILQIPGFNP